MKNLLKKQKGFTIIEVLIVLAIAGLIMLIVFLAVPALQRNNRNSQRKNDVSALLGAVNEFTSNNGGQMPTTTAELLANARLGYYTGGNGTAAGQVETRAGAVAALAANAANDRVRVVTAARCGAAGAAIAGSARQVVVQYQTETSGAPIATCQES